MDSLRLHSDPPLVPSLLSSDKDDNIVGASSNSFLKTTTRDRWNGIIHELLLNKGLRDVVRKLEERKVNTTIETAATARSLLNERGLFSSTNYITSDLEQMIFDSFLEDDDSSLHMLTLRSLHQTDFAEGAIFWRDLSTKEMKEWIEPAALDGSDMERILNDHDHKWEVVKRKLVRHASDKPIDTLFNDWIKIELVVTHKDHLGKRIGTLLMVMALVHATHVLQQNQTGSSCAKHAILHAAGGAENIAAVSLYKRLGFYEPQGNMFKEPHKNVFVLPHIHETLIHMKWDEVLGKTHQEKEAAISEYPPLPTDRSLLITSLNPSR